MINLFDRFGVGVLYWLINRHYPVYYWLAVYNFCSEPVVDKLLAKQSVSEHNFQMTCFNTTPAPRLSKRERAGQTSHLSVFSYKRSTFIIYKLCLRI